MNKTVNKANATFRKMIKKSLTLKIKKNALIKREIASFKQHFKADKWVLGYEVNKPKELTNWEFNLLLEQLGYRVFYRPSSVSLVFKPRSAK